jgi:hypothetical protein
MPESTFTKPQSFWNKPKNKGFSLREQGIFSIGFRVNAVRSLMVLVEILTKGRFVAYLYLAEIREQQGF